MRNIKSNQPTQSYTTLPQKGEKRNSSSLSCKRVLSPSNNKQTNKKIKPKSFDTESHSSCNSSHPSKFDFSSPLENEIEVIQNSLENSNEEDFQKSVQRVHTKFTYVILSIVQQILKEILQKTIGSNLVACISFI